jgi:thiamine biosynthesis lipoprotein
MRLQLTHLLANGHAPSLKRPLRRLNFAARRHTLPSVRRQLHEQGTNKTMLPGTAPRQRRLDLLPPCVAAAPTPAPGGWLLREQAVMGTAIRVELWCDDARAGAAAAAAMMDEMHRIDRLMSPHKPASELSRINRDAGHKAVPLSEEMLRLLQRALEYSRFSGGAFDISYAAVGCLYDYRAGIRPSAQALAAARQAVGWQQLQLDARAHTLRFGRPGMRIDLGGFAKGHAVDNAVAILKRRGIRHAYVAAGGDSCVIGDRRGRPWTIAIRDPRSADGVVAVLPLEDCAVSTSGDYERCFERDGVRHHHLIDPATGDSARRVRSVTVLGPDGLSTEALGKAVFVLGAQQGLALLAQVPGVDAVVVDAEGRLHVSPGLLQAPATGRPQAQPAQKAA